MCAPALTPEHAAPLDADILCVKCHYNLRGLQPNKRCPECGLLIAVSLPNRRAVSIADWISIRRALLRVLIANLLIPVVLLAVLIADYNAPPHLVFLPPLIGTLLITFLAFVRSSGYALISAVDRAFDRTPEEWDAYVAVGQMAAVRAFLVPVLFPLLYLAPHSMRGDLQAILLPLLLITSLAYVAAGAFQFGALQYLLSRLGYRSRIPNLGRTVTSYAAVCVFGVVGTLAWGLGAPVAWFAYHALLIRFLWIAHQKTRDYRHAS